MAMEILEKIYPKGTNIFDLSTMSSYSYDTNYQLLSIMLNVRMLSGSSDYVIMYLNGTNVWQGSLSSSYRKPYLEIPHTNFSGSLSNITITAKYYHFGTTYDIPIEVESVSVYRDYVQPYLSTYQAINLNVNGTSRIKFTGSKYCTGVAGSTNGGTSFYEQAIPGTLIVSGNTATGEVLIPPGVFKEGVNSGRVRGVNHTRQQSEGWNTTYGTAELSPTVVTGLNVGEGRISRDRPITCTWESSPQQTKRQIKYKTKDATEVVLAIEETISKTHTFVAGIFSEGKNTISVRIFDGMYWSGWTDKEITVETNRITLEPNKIAQNKDKSIIAMWNTVEEQQQFKLLYSGAVSGEIIGTTAKSHTFPAGFFSNGNVTLTLKVFNGYVWTEKVSSFMSYGAPPNPVLTTSATYATAIPNFTWTATEQVSYRVQALKESTIVLDSGEVYSSNKSHQFTNVLENNTAYTVRLRVRNQYEIESEWVFKSFTVAFTELQKANFDMFSNDRLGNIMFNIYNAVGQSNFKHCEVLRREYGKSEWAKIASDLGVTATYTDYTCRSSVLYEYKVRAIGTSGGYTDSEVGLKQVKLRNTMLSDTTDFNNYAVLIHNPKKARTFTKETYAMKYSGLRSPRFEFGDSKYIGVGVDFTVTEETLDKLLELYYSNNVLMLRDNRGKRIFGHISGDISAPDAEFMKYDVSFNFIETEYSEGVLV